MHPFVLLNRPESKGRCFGFLVYAIVMPTGKAGGCLLLEKHNSDHLDGGEQLHRIKQRIFPPLPRGLAVVHGLFDRKSRSNYFK